MNYEGVPEYLTASVEEILEANDDDAIALEAQLLNDTVNDPPEEQ